MAGKGGASLSPPQVKGQFLAGLGTQGTWYGLSPASPPLPFPEAGLAGTSRPPAAGVRLSCRAPGPPLFGPGHVCISPKKPALRLQSGWVSPVGLHISLGVGPSPGPWTLEQDGL